MSVCSTILGGLWQSYMASTTEYSVAQTAFMKGIGDYISSNVLVSVVFTGALIAFPNTPIVTPDVLPVNGSVVGAAPIFPSPVTDPSAAEAAWLSWITQVYSKITSSSILLPSLAPTGVVPTGTLSPWLMVSPSWQRSALMGIHQANWQDPQGAVLDAMANFIKLDMTTMFKPTPFPALYGGGTYTGTFTITSITTP